MEFEIKRAVKRFLKKHGMEPSAIDIDYECGKFIAEMKAGLGNSPKSLQMLPAYLTAGREIPIGEPVIAIDAGGTNLRTALIHFDSERKPVIEDFQARPIPGSQGKITAKEFFGAIADYISPLVGRAERIGFCFSYPTAMMPSGDGTLIRFTKEILVEDVEGKSVVKGLLDALKVTGKPAPKSFTLLSDTVATLLGGQAARPDRKYASYMGFILGTGINTCYIESNAAIRKITGLDKAGTMIINIESGAYTGAPRGKLDRQCDATTANPGEHMLEKMISGGYFGDLALLVLKRAAAEGLIAGPCAASITALTELAPKDIDAYMFDPHAAGLLSDCCGPATQENARNRTTLYLLLDALFERAAKLVAVNLCAVVRKTGCGQDPCMPVCITADGAMFHKSRSMRIKIEYYIKDYLQDGLGLYCDIIEVENSTLLGTAIAGLTAVHFRSGG
jgi:hexokinase